MTQDGLFKKLDDWIVQFLKFYVPMSEDLAEIFVWCSMLELQASTCPKSLQDTFLFQVANKRALYIGMKPTMSALAFLASLCESPGTVVMYLSVLRRKLGPIELTMASIASVFPFGFPTDEHLSTLWNAQKIDGSNLVDLLNFNESICQN